MTLGIEPQDQVDYSFPFPVSIDVTNIGGPSAGLAMTLGVIDTLSGGNLTGGRRWRPPAPWTTRATSGTSAASRRRRSPSNAPAPPSSWCLPQEYKAALSKKTPGLQIYAVSTLDQALRVLADHGGHVPATPVSNAIGMNGLVQHRVVGSAYA